jgi:hypothetical protein
MSAQQNKQNAQDAYAAFGNKDAEGGDLTQFNRVFAK